MPKLEDRLSTTTSPDKYELLDWIFETELQEQVTNNLNYISGFQLLDELVFYFSQNRSFYAQLFDIKSKMIFIPILVITATF